MGDKVINELLVMYDEYLDTLRHISGFKIDTDLANYVNSFSSMNETDKFLNEGVEGSHLAIIEQFINNMIGTINLSDVRDLRTFIYYPDFKVKTYINNPATLYRNNSAIEKATIISPAYELNLVVNDINKIEGRTFVLRIKRLALSPKVDVFSCINDSVDELTFNCLVKDLTRRFKTRYGVDPNYDDLVLLKSISIRYIFEKIKRKGKNGLDVFTRDDAFVSYDYNATKKNICDMYGVSYKDNYKSKSNINNPWIYRDLVNFDNREVVERDKSVIPLTYMRTRK